MPDKCYCPIFCNSEAGKHCGNPFCRYMKEAATEQCEVCGEPATCVNVHTHEHLCGECSDFTTNLILVLRSNQAALRRQNLRHRGSIHEILSSSSFIAA